MSTVRSNCWSLTIYHNVNDEPIDETYTTPTLPPGWHVEGQIERCPKTEKLHYQGMAKTPQIRMSALCKVFGKKNHYEKARNVNDLTTYVHKPETRVAEVASKSVMNMYDFSKHVAEMWEEERYAEIYEKANKKSYDSDGKYKFDEGEIVLEYVDELIGECIEEGVEGAEWNGTNPAFRAMWKKFGRAVVKKTLRARQDRQTDTPAEA